MIWLHDCERLEPPVAQQCLRGTGPAAASLGCCRLPCRCLGGSELAVVAHDVEAGITEAVYRVDCPCLNEGDAIILAPSVEVVDQLLEGDVRWASEDSVRWRDRWSVVGHILVVRIVS